MELLHHQQPAPASGTYTATVTAVNPVDSQVATTVVVIVVEPVYTIYFPVVVGKPQ